MSKQFIKRRNSTQKLEPNETWSSGDPFLASKLTKLTKPPRKLIQNFMTTQHEYDESYRDQEQSQSQMQYNKGAYREHSKQKQFKFKYKKKNHHDIDNDYEDQQQDDAAASVNSSSNMIGRSKSRLDNTTKDIEYRLHEIQLIMGQQNENLRQQKQYLLRTIYKLQQKQKQYKSSLSQYRQRTIQLQQQNHLLREKYQKAREFITTGIGKMQQVIAKQPVDSMPSSASVNSYQTISHQNSINLTQNIDQLNDKFDALMYQYQKTRQPELRKQCMEIAKELKKLRKIQESGKKS